MTRTHPMAVLCALYALGMICACEDDPPPAPPPPPPPKAAPAPEAPTEEAPAEEEPDKPAGLLAIGDARNLTETALAYRTLFSRSKAAGVAVVTAPTADRFLLVAELKTQADAAAEALAVEVREVPLTGAPAEGKAPAAEEPAAKEEPAAEEPAAEEPAAKEEPAAAEPAAEEPAAKEEPAAAEPWEPVRFEPQVARTVGAVALRSGPEDESDFVRTLPPGTIVVALHGNHGDHTSAADPEGHSRVVAARSTGGWADSEALVPHDDCVPLETAGLLPEEQREALADDLLLSAVQYRKAGAQVDGFLLTTRDLEEARSHVGVYESSRTCELSDGRLLALDGVVSDAMVVLLARADGDSALLLGTHPKRQLDRKGRVNWGAYLLDADEPFWKQTLATGYTLERRDRDVVEINHTIRVGSRSDYYPLRLSRVDRPPESLLYEDGDFKKADVAEEDQGPDPGRVNKLLVGMWRDMPELLGSTDGERMFFATDGSYGWAAPEARSAKPIKANLGEGVFRTGRWGVTNGVLMLVQHQHKLGDVVQPTRPMEIRKIDIGPCDKGSGETELTCVTFAGSPFWRYQGSSRDAAQAVRDGLAE